MPANSRLAVATHLLTMLAFVEEDPAHEAPISSETLAHSVNTSPIVVRKLLCALRQAGLVVGHAGRHGGATLARPPAQITLEDVRRAVDETHVFALGHNPPDPFCVVGSRIGELLSEVFAGVERSLSGELAKTRISDLVARARRAPHRRRT